MNDDEQQRNDYRQILADKIADLPAKPGVYQYFNADSEVIYVGKAKSLRSRVRSYFHSGRIVDAKTKVLVSKIRDVQVIVTDSEVEALILENNLIKRFQPRYNILLKDDKSYPFIRITNEEFPRVFSTRKVMRDGSRYYGPYTDGKYLHYLLKTIYAMFPLRSCDLPLTEQSIVAGKFKVCLDYYIKKCEGPCEGYVSRERYNSYIEQCAEILGGRARYVEKLLEAEMTSQADAMNFEEAAVARNRLSALREYSSKQKILTVDDIERDVIAVAREDEDVCAVIFNVRDGKMIGKRHFYLKTSLAADNAELMRRVIETYYFDNDFTPEEIIISCEADNTPILREWLRLRKKSAVNIESPKIGDKKKLVDMAVTNAEFQLRELAIARSRREQSLPRGVLSLERDLRMSRPPRRIECFDNSHLQGSDYVSSLVVFIDGRPAKSEYRKFKIKTFAGNDDFEAMREVIHRRYSRVLEEKLPIPDLIIIDGGKGQLSAAMGALTDLGMNEKSTVIGLAKRLEEVFLPNESEPVLMPRTSTSLRLLQSARDEAHRFAVTYHRQLRDKRVFHTELTDIPGIGEKTAQKLLVKFGSVEGVRRASEEELALFAGKKTSLRLYEYFHDTGEEK
ncbi:excinuclease ABC subunit UvrC [Ignavibacteria bacterium]|nr:excinuclease ABC subunit C [Bacteroidota bacterium]MCZ2133548.1 excinuclease ABC subunit UvrC [Bacteroidota bacterium]